MTHADTGRGPRRAGDAGSRGAPLAGGAPRLRPRGRPYTRSIELDVDWERVGLFGAGLALGALVGAGAALLTAPRSGAQTRTLIAHAGRTAGGRAARSAADTWDGLADEMRVLRARARRDVRQRVRTGRRDVTDAIGELDRRAKDGLRALREWRRDR